MLLVLRLMPSGTAPYLAILMVSFLNEGILAFGRLLHEYLGTDWAIADVMAIQASAVKQKMFVNFISG